MSTDRDTTRIVRSWLAEDGHENADRVLDIVLDQIDTTPQRRATWWPVRRPLTMHSTIRYGAAAAVVALAALVGFTVLNNQVGNDPTPTPSPSDTALVPLPAELQHQFSGQPRQLSGMSGEATAAILVFDGRTFTFDMGNTEVLKSTAAVTGPGQLRLTTDRNGYTCQIGDEGVYEYSFSPGKSFMTISGTDECAAREAAVVGTWQTSNCRSPSDGCLGDLEAGTYSSQYFEPRPQDGYARRFGALTYTVPEGWAAGEDYPDGYALITQEAYAKADPAAEGCAECPDGIGIWAGPQAMPEDCSDAALPGIGTSAAALADWLRQNPSVVVDDQPSITIDGRSAIVMDVEAARDATGTCGEGGEAGVPLLYGGWAVAVPAGDRQRVILLDLGGGDTVLILIDTVDPADIDDIVARAMPIIESFQFPPR
jgi:hypothetical protein